MAFGRSDWRLPTLVLAALLWLASLPGDGTAAAAPPPQAEKNFQYTGPGSCASSACHGSVRPRGDTRVPQNEYSIWIVQDKHSKAFTQLSNPLSQTIARNLGMKERPDHADRCLTCHSLNVPPSLQARTFDPTDGVSCELCHGPASAWLGPHTTRGWTHAQSVALGMKETKDLVTRTQVCLSCHLGTAERPMTHEMLAAGHPDLTFELDSYSAVMPRHWRQPLDQDPWIDVREWSVGQAAQLRDSLLQLGRRARGPQWPEFMEMDCFACHHALTKPQDSWRQQVGYPGRQPGVPPWSRSRSIVFQQFLQQIDPGSASQLGGALEEVAGDMNQLQPDKDKVAQAADRAAQVADQVARELPAYRYDGPSTLRALHAITQHSDELGAQERSAEQAVMAVDSLFLAYTRRQKLANQAQVEAAINDLFRQLENPSAYDARRFAETLRRVGSLLPAA